ncbi:MAG: FtsQ-type POTRA domain-containing protein [Candidatus Doudnabacteria bacterium]|nr:FtsQ-type POTRA domain-containing protein [Candidatus Doudnabacteria bacterium]
MIISKHRRKPKRDFGSKEFRTKLKAAASYKRIFPSQKLPILRFFIRSKVGRFTTIALLLVLIYFLFFASTFRVVNVTVSGNTQVSSEQIRDALIRAGEDRAFLIPKNHSILLSRGYVNSLLTAKLPMVKEISKSKRSWPDSISLTVTERNKGFILRTNNQDYLVDEEGMVIKQTSEEKELLQVANFLEENVAINEPLNPKLAAFIVSVQRQWSSKVNTGLTGAKISGKASLEVQFVSSEGWSALLDINRPVLTQLSSLALILNRQVPPKDRSRLAYIDLRLEKWAYYCFKGTPCSVQPQEESILNQEKNATK